MAQFKRLVGGSLSVLMALTASIAGVTSTAYAATLVHASATPSDPRGGVSTDYTVSFNVGSTTDIKAISLEFNNKASGTGLAVASLSLAGSVQLQAGSHDTITAAGSPVTGWTTTPNDSTKKILIANASGAASGLAVGNTVSFVLQNIGNNDAADVSGNACDTNVNSDSCFIRIGTYSDAAGTVPIDKTVVTYTVIKDISVSATVDPSLTFTVAGVTSLTSLNGNDGNAACTGADTTATATAIPFGNIQIAAPACAQQSLSVVTNAPFGYSVSNYFVGSVSTTDLMKGTAQSTNNIDPFTGSSATFSSPQAFIAPAGTTANANTGYLGVRVKTPLSMTSYTNNFGTSNYYAPPAVGFSAANKVMDKDTPDDGTEATYVTYKIQVNAKQPADKYTGIVVYDLTGRY